jgi:hypothetical protein
MASTAGPNIVLKSGQARKNKLTPVVDKVGMGGRAGCVGIGWILPGLGGW